jgi:hypothetical protein
MKLNSVLDTTFSTAKPSTGAAMNSAPAPVSTVYRNGALFAPGVPPAVANVAAGLYSLTHGLTMANGYTLNDFVTITEQVVLDGIVVVRPAWEGNLIQDGAPVTMLLNQTIYPLFTTHWPETGANSAPDGGIAPVITIYRNLVVTAIVPVLLNPAVGVYIVTLPLTLAAGWATGDSVDILATCTMDGVAAASWVFSEGLIVASAGGGGGVPHHEIIGHEIRYT